MFNESYSDNSFNTNLYPLLGYDKPEQDSFSLTNKFIQSWSFDGVIPLQLNYVDVYNKDYGVFNVKPGDYIYVLNESTNQFETKPVISVTTDPDLSYFSENGEEGGTQITSFTSNVFIEYLDEMGLSKIQTIVTELDEEGFPSNKVSLLSENWEQKILGSSGWMISSSGNAIFNNLAIRGEIDAVSGKFSGNLSVNNGDMKIGSGVSPTKSYSVSAFEILDDKVILTIGTHTFAVGDVVSVRGVDSLGSMAATFPANATITNVSGNGTQITYTASNTFSAGMKVQITGVNPTDYNLTSVEISSRNSTSFVVDGTTTSSYVSGGLATVISVPTTAVDINGEYIITDITSTKISYDFFANDFAETAVSDGMVESIIGNDGIFINENNYWYDDGTFKFGNDTNNVLWNTKPLVPRLEVSGDVYANSGRIGTLNSTSDASWQIATGLIRSGEGTSSVVIASPALNFTGEANQTIERYSIEKLVIDNEGGGLSTLYLHITVPDLQTFLETQLDITITDEFELSDAVSEYFLTKPILFKNIISGEQNIFSTTINPSLATKTANKWLNVQAAGDYSVSLVSGDAVYADAPTTDLVVLEFWGEDYGYVSTDETITSNISDTYHWTTEQIDILSGSTGAGNYFFWAGAELAGDAPFSIDTEGLLYSQSITSDSINAEEAAFNSFLLDNHRVTISTTEPPDPTDGDIWIEIV
jgi:hypothetical protein